MKIKGVHIQANNSTVITRVLLIGGFRLLRCYVARMAETLQRKFADKRNLPETR
jgi:hypothetical protein